MFVNFVCGNLCNYASLVLVMQHVMQFYTPHSENVKIDVIDVNGDENNNDMNTDANINVIVIIQSLALMRMIV